MRKVARAVMVAFVCLSVCLSVCIAWAWDRDGAQESRLAVIECVDYTQGDAQAK